MLAGDSTKAVNLHLVLTMPDKVKICVNEAASLARLLYKLRPP